jgi:hypothetical protein
MQYLKNNTARLIIVGSLRLIPRIPVKVANLEAIQKLYPEITAMLQSNQLVVEEEKKAVAEIKKVEAEIKADKVEKTEEVVEDKPKKKTTKKTKKEDK